MEDETRDAISVKMKKHTVVSSIVWLLFSLSCAEEPPPAAGGSPFPEPDQILQDTRMTLTESGKTVAILEAQIVKVYEDSNYASLEDSVIVYFFSREGEHTTTLTASSGEIWGLYEKADSLKASGNVVVSSEKNDAYLEAPAIRWIASAGMVYGEGTVRLNSENGYEEGTGFEAKDDLSEYRFRGPVSGEVRGKDVKLDER